MLAINAVDCAPSFGPVNTTANGWRSILKQGGAGVSKSCPQLWATSHLVPEAWDRCRVIMRNAMRPAAEDVEESVSAA